MCVQLVVPVPALPQDLDQLVRGIQPSPVRKLETPLGNGVEKHRLSVKALPDMRKRPIQQGRHLTNPVMGIWIDQGIRDDPANPFLILDRPVPGMPGDLHCVVS